MRKKVLIVDDDPAVRRLVRRALSDLDCDLVEASDGSDVPGLVSDLRPSVVLLDIHMPELDGISVVDELSRGHPDVRVIVVSGDATEQRARLAMERGARDFIAKPIDFGCLRRTVEANLLASD